MSTERDSRLQWIYASRGADQLRERYDVWAADYDSDLDELRVEGPAGRCRALRPLRQAGCRDPRCRLRHGSGRRGARRTGHRRIVGFDLSEGMLAAQRGARRLLRAASGIVARALAVRRRPFRICGRRSACSPGPCRRLGVCRIGQGDNPRWSRLDHLPRRRRRSISATGRSNSD